MGDRLLDLTRSRQRVREREPVLRLLRVETDRLFERRNGLAETALLQERDPRPEKRESIVRITLEDSRERRDRLVECAAAEQGFPLEKQVALRDAVLRVWKVFARRARRASGAEIAERPQPGDRLPVLVRAGGRAAATRSRASP